MGPNWWVWISEIRQLGLWGARIVNFLRCHQRRGGWVEEGFTIVKRLVRAFTTIKTAAMQMFWIYRPVQAAFHRPWVSLRNFGSTRFLGMGYIIWWRPTELSPSRSCCFSKICSYLYACTMSAKFGAQKRGYVPLKHAYTLWIVRMALPLRRIQCPTSQHHCCPATVFRTWWRPIGMCEAYPGIVRESWQNLDKHVTHVVAC